MSGSARSERLLDALSRLSPQQAALRLLMLLGAGGFLLAEGAVGASFSGWWLVAVAVVAVAAAVLPDSFAPLAAAAAVPVWALSRVGAAFDLPAGGPVLAVALLVLLGWAVVLGRHAVTRS